MREIILEELRKIEEQENVKIIMAIESGSRAWGFASPDSDYDVRFIYVRKETDYLKLERFRDVIEWCASPIVYLETEEFTWLKEILPMYFSEKKSLYHYWHTADSTYRDHLMCDEVKVKKYFYALRPLLAAKWILDKKTAPPMLFEELMKAELEEELKPELERLLALKKTLPEMGMAPKIPIIDAYIQQKLPEIKELAEEIEGKVSEWDALNELFLRMVK